MTDERQPKIFVLVPLAVFVPAVSCVQRCFFHQNPSTNPKESESDETIPIKIVLVVSPNTKLKGFVDDSRNLRQGGSRGAITGT